jgi:hypothetical protein
LGESSGTEVGGGLGLFCALAFRGGMVLSSSVFHSIRFDMSMPKKLYIYHSSLIESIMMQGRGLPECIRSKEKRNGMRGDHGGRAEAGYWYEVVQQDKEKGESQLM